VAQAFIGLDLGTTGIKAVAFDAQDRQLAQAVVPTPTNRLGPASAEYDADELWAAACDVLGQVNQQLDDAGHRAAAVATASMAEAGVLLDAAGRPVAPVIAWFDQRTEPQAQWWRDEVGIERTHQIAALPPRPVFGVMKMLWTKQHLPDAWAIGRRWLNMADWVAYRLSGVMATDYSLASRTMVLDLAHRSWSQELLDACRIDASLLAPLVQGGTALGPVTAEAAAQTGLPSGTVVGAGGQDHVCAAVALGVTEPGMLLDSIGTAEAFFLVTDAPDTSGRIATTGVGQGAHVVADRTYAMTGLQQGGGRIDAERDRLGLDWDEFLATESAALVIDEVARDGQARIEVLIEATGATDIRHLVTGGGSRNHRLIDQKRRIGNRPIEVAEQVEATALGAARLAMQSLAEAS